MKGLVIENRDGTACMAQHDGPQTLHYVDPPYRFDTRSDKMHRAGCYAHEMTDGQHDQLLAFLPTLAGMVVLSGYPHPSYDAALPGWEIIEVDAHADGALDRTEVLWINPQCAAALHAGPLFATA